MGKQIDCFLSWERIQCETMAGSLEHRMKRQKTWVPLGDLEKAALLDSKLIQVSLIPRGYLPQAFSEAASVS